MADGGSGESRAGTALLRRYLAVQTALVVTALVTPSPVRDILWLVSSALGVLALLMGIQRFRPAVRAGWWFIAAASAAVFGTAVEFAILATVNGDVSSLPSVLAYPLLAVGLALIGRSRAHSDAADLLDATVAALGVFVILWMFLLEPAVQAQREPLAGMVVDSVGMLVVFAMAVKLVLSVGPRTPSLVLLVLGVASLLGATVPILALTNGLVAPAGQWLLGAYLILVGAAGLHPSIARLAPPPARPATQLTPPRVALLAALALVGPAAWFIGATRDTASYTVPLITGSALSLLLLGRLGLIARVAEHRGGELVHRTVALGEAVQEQEALQAQLAYRALHDPLTGLSNRVVLVEQLEWALTRRAGSGEHALLLLDLDGFKDINDSLGHPVGDELLVTVAHRLLEMVSPDATLVRLGGDEFAVLLKDIGADDATDFAERVRKEIRRPYRILGRDLFVTTSIGLLLTHPGGRHLTPSGALRDADLALYAAKAHGKNQVVTFHPNLRAARLAHARLSFGLHRAITNDELKLRYQPIVDLPTEKIVAVEALLRWTPPHGKPIPPTEFIPVAEEIGLIGAIGEWALRRAAADARSWFVDCGVAFSVNVSGRQLEDPNLADVVLDALAVAELPGEALIIEVTETSLIATSHTTSAVSQLERLRANGVRVAIDDFGTGYSSLAYVSHLPVDIVKIDRSFLQQTDTSTPIPENWAFTQAILHLVEGLRLQAVAEGIETPEQADALRTLRCPLAQGYHFCPPVPNKDIDRMLLGAHWARTRRR